MRRIITMFTLAAALAAVLVMSAIPAIAASPHFKNGGTPVCTVTSGGTTASASCTGSLAGLGNGDVTINTTLQGFAVYQCQNQGGNTAPGQNKVLEGPTTTPTTIPAGDIKNGNLTYTAGGSLTAANTVSGAAAGCPNGNWTGVNPTLTVTSISETISQGGVTLFTCSASNPNGVSGSVPLTCV
jgi:hypothetical protein